MVSVFNTIFSFYSSHRRSFPWRETTDRYAILVSEVMLQQTQTHRVVPKYVSFLERFPTVEVLAESSLRDVLSLWVGLGYNRRAVMLHRAAQRVMKDFNGVVPKDRESLLLLPGVGPYVSGAVRAFADNSWSVCIETNIRTVIMYHCFPEVSGKVSDAEIEEKLEALISIAKRRKVAPRDFYAALMDYGSHLKSNGVRLNTKQKGYVAQSPFAGSVRQARGCILKTLTAKGSMRVPQLKKVVEHDEFHTALDALVREGVVAKKRDSVVIC